MNEYKARPGAPFTDDDAQVIGPIIDRLIGEAPSGILRPDMVVENAKRLSSPLHQYFDWDDTGAAAKWRVHQARMMICSVIVVVKDAPREQSVRAFYNIHDVVEGEEGKEKERGYVTLENVMDNEEYRRQVVAVALREAEGWANKYRTYRELRPVTRAVDDFVKEWKKEQEKENAKA